MTQTGTTSALSGGLMSTGRSYREVADGQGQQRRLKRLLKVFDVSGLVVAWTSAYLAMLALGAAQPTARLQLTLLGGVGVVSSLVVMASKRLWLARVCAVRSTQIAGLGQMAALSALVVLAVGQVTDYDAPDRFALAGALFSFVIVTTVRMAYESWLRRARRRGRFTRPLVVFGAGQQSADLARLINRHPESGYQIVGVLGPRNEAAQFGSDVQWLGDDDAALDVVADAGATGALVFGSAYEPSDLNVTLRRLLRQGLHVHLASGVRGISHERLLPLPLLREPLFYLESASLTRSQLLLKRVMDVGLGAVLLLLTLPLQLVAAAAVKLDDGGPVLFRQKRVGRDGNTFTLYKLRTMHVDAESQLDRLRQHNQRTGPLFKLSRDPRVTRVGRVLRATSVDELPQLVNVLLGNMSLVGPRPALPDEVEAFDDELRERGRMMPGITGLWQVEARDDPSFASYRRLDLYYIENWSITLDLAILLSTAGVVIPRGLRRVFARHEDPRRI